MNEIADLVRLGKWSFVLLPHLSEKLGVNHYSGTSAPVIRLRHVLNSNWTGHE